MQSVEGLRGFHLNVLVHGQQGPEHKSPVPTIAVTRGITEKGNIFIQLRDKGMSDREMITLGMQLRQSLPQDVPLIINDRVAVALAIRDSGVKGILGIHIGQKDMGEYSTKRIRELIGDDMVLGVSAATVAQAKQAVEDGADYLGVGPLFPTTSKNDAEPPIGLRGLAAIRAVLPDIPIIAIGGITKENAEGVMRFGANGIAVISAVLEAEDPLVAAEELAMIVTPQELIPRLTHEGTFIQLDKDGNYIGRGMSRQETETIGTSPVVNVLLFRGKGAEREILLQQRALHKSRWAGEWEGGIVETGQMNPDDPWEPEHPKETAARGLEEEFQIKNVTVDTTVYFNRHTEKEGGASSIITVYTAQYDENTHGQIIPDREEVEKVEWVPAHMLPKMIEEGSRPFNQGFQTFVMTYPALFN